MSSSVTDTEILMTLRNRQRVVTALQLCSRGLAMSSPSFCLSVCPSVKRVNCDKTKEILPTFYSL